MTLQSHPNSSPQRQWLWRWELTVTCFPPFSLQTVLSWFPSTEGCPADASGQTAVQSRHVSSGTGNLETGQYGEIFFFYPPPFFPAKLLCDSPLMPLDSPHHFFRQWCFPRLQLGVVMGHCCSAQHFRHRHSPASVTANYSLIAQGCLDEKLLLTLKR